MSDTPILADAENPAYATAADVFGTVREQPLPVPGLSVSPGLTEVPNSVVPGGEHSHVYGSQQAACDPVAAGLDVNHDPRTTADNRVVTRADGTAYVPVEDGENAKVPGPSSSAGVA